MGKPGRPALEPRIAALENIVQRLEDEIKLLRMAAEQRQVVPRGTLNAYEPRFDRWPDKSSA